MKKLICIFLICLSSCESLENSKEPAYRTWADSGVTASPDTILHYYDGNESADSAWAPVLADSTSVSVPDPAPSSGRGPASVIEDTLEVKGTINELGQLIFYCPKKLKEGQSVHVTAAISNQVDPVIEREIVLNRVNSQNAIRGEENISINDVDTRQIEILDSVKLELEDPSKRVEITPESDQVLWRRLDKGQTVEWSWYIIPKKEEGGKAPVILYLKAFTKNVGMPPKKTVHQYYTLSIDLPETVLQAFLRKLRDIDWVVGIIGAIIAYFLGIWRERKKQKKAE